MFHWHTLADLECLANYDTIHQFMLNLEENRAKMLQLVLQVSSPLPLVHSKSYMCFNEACLRTLERMQWNLDNGYVELVPGLISMP